MLDYHSTHTVSSVDIGVMVRDGLLFSESSILKSLDLRDCFSHEMIFFTRKIHRNAADQIATFSYLRDKFFQKSRFLHENSRKIHTFGSSVVIMVVSMAERSQYGHFYAF